LKRRARAAEGGIPIGAHCYARGNCKAGAITGACNRATPALTRDRRVSPRREAKKSYARSGHGHHAGAVLVLQRAVRQFRIGAVVVARADLAGGAAWLSANGVEVIDLDSRDCRELLERLSAHT